MHFETVRFEEESCVAVISLLAPPEVGNEVSQLGVELSECCQSFRNGSELKVLVIQEIRSPLEMPCLGSEGN